MGYVEGKNHKFQISNSKQISITKIPNFKQAQDIGSQDLKRYDLEDRTLEFSKRIIRLAKALPKNSINFELTKQAVRSGASVGANYREANETETKKDFQFRLRISRKEAKETVYWLNLIIEANPEITERIKPLLQENQELLKIFAAILEKIKKKNAE